MAFQCHVIGARQSVDTIFIPHERQTVRLNSLWRTLTIEPDAVLGRRPPVVSTC